MWKPDEGRELLLYPWFSPHQRLGNLDCWATDLALRLGETAGLYVGDEQGALSAYRVQTSPLQLTRWRRQPKAHSLGITRLLLLAQEHLLRVRVTVNPDPDPNPKPKPKPKPNQEHLLVSASYDNTVRLFDTMTGTAVLTIENMNKCRFSALCWHAAHQARPLRNPEPKPEP